MAEELFLGGGGGGGSSLVAGTNITLSTSGGTITIIGGVNTGATTFLAGISTGGNTLGTTGMVVNQLVLVGGTNVTLSQSTNVGSATVTISGNNPFSAGVTTLGNTAGTTGTVSNQVVFVGGSNITLSQSSAAGGATVSFVGAAAATGISGIAGSAASTVTNGTLVFANSNSMSFGLNGSTMTGSFSVSNTAPPIATAVQLISGIASTGTVTRFAPEDHQHIGLAGVNASGTASTFVGSLMLSAGNNFSLASGGVSNAGSLQLINVLSSSAIAQNVSNVSSAGTLSSRFALADHAHVGLAGLNVSGTASTFVGNLMLSVGNNLTMSTAGNSSAGTIELFNLLSTSAQVQPVSNVSVAGTNSSAYAMADHAHVGVAGINMSGTASTFVGNVMISAGNNLTMSTGGNSSAGTVELFNLLSSSAIAQNVSNVSSAGTQSSRFALADHAHLGVAGIVPNATASSFVGYMNLSGGSNISLASGGNSSAGTIAIHNIGAGTGVTTATTAGPLALTLASGGLSFGIPYRTRYIYPQDQHLTVVSAPVLGSATFRYVDVGAPGITGTRIDALVLWSASSSATANTAAIAMSAYAAIYTRNVSTLSSLSSGSTQTTYSYASNTAGNTQLISAAIRPVSVPVNFNLPPGEYIVGFNFSTAASSVGTATTALGQTLSMIGVVGAVTASNYAADFTAQTASSTNLWGGMGVYTSADTALSSSPLLANIGQTGARFSQANIALVFRNA